MKKRVRGGEDDTLQAYLREISTFPSLTREEERDLGRRIRAQRDQRAFRRLVESNLRFVVGYAGGYRGLGVLLLDLIDEANLGLMEAARRFDPELDGEFTRYAQWWIREAILHALAERGRVFVVPGAAVGVAGPTTPGDFPAVDRAAIDRGTVPFEARARSSRFLEDRTVRRAIAEQVREALDQLEPREREVMRLRLGLDSAGPLSAAATAARLRLTPAQLQRIENRGRRKLRRVQKARELRSSLN